MRACTGRRPSTLPRESNPRGTAIVPLPLDLHEQVHLCNDDLHARRPMSPSANRGKPIPANGSATHPLGKSFERRLRVHPALAEAQPSQSKSLIAQTEINTDLTTMHPGAWVLGAFRKTLFCHGLVPLSSDLTGRHIGWPMPTIDFGRLTISFIDDILVSRTDPLTDTECTLDPQLRRRRRT